MITVYKYPFAISDNVTIHLPVNAKILKVDTQGGQACMWAMVDTDYESESRKFRIYGTGHELDKQWLPRTNSLENMQFVSTFFQGPFVWHMFEEMRS